MTINSALLLLAAQSAFTVTNSGYTGLVERPASAHLVWHDEFGGTALDTARWQYDTAFNKSGWFNKERQYYSAGRADNLRVANGVLTIELDAPTHERLVAAFKKAPESQMTVDLPSQTVEYGDVKTSFTINSFSKTCLLEGLDELGYILRYDPQIAAFEKNR